MESNIDILGDRLRYSISMDSFYMELFHRHAEVIELKER